MRRQFRTVTRTDDTTYTEVSIGEYGRDGWGPGGHDLDWYCTSNTEAHHGRQPVYLENRAELVALMGPAGVRGAARRCARTSTPGRGRPAAPSGRPGLRARAGSGGRFRPSEVGGTMEACTSIICRSRPARKVWRRPRERLERAAGGRVPRRRVPPALRHPEPHPSADRRPATSRSSTFWTTPRPTRRRSARPSGRVRSTAAAGWAGSSPSTTSVPSSNGSAGRPSTATATCPTGPAALAPDRREGPAVGPPAAVLHQLDQRARPPPVGRRRPGQADPSSRSPGTATGSTTGWAARPDAVSADVEIDWLDPDGQPGLVAAIFATAAGTVRI